MPNEYYDPPYLDETEHSTVDHTGTPGVPQSGASEPLITQFWVPVPPFNSVGGIGGLTSFIFTFGDVTILTPSALLPMAWSTFAVDLWWTSAVGTAGNMVWTIRPVVFLTDESVIAANPGGTDLVVPAGTQWAVKVTPALATVTNEPGKLAQFYIRRNGDGPDTLAGDAHLLGLMCRKLT